LVDCLVEHDRVDLVHGFRYRQLCSPQFRRVDHNPVSIGGTLLGALCFLLGAILMFRHGSVQFERPRNH